MADLSAATAGTGARLGTGVPGLDRVLGGGLWPGSLYVVQGPPGSGKTILANQLCAATARRGGKALYVSLLAESFSGMLQHMRRLAFFDPETIGSSIVYISAFSAYEEGGLAGIVGLLRAEAQRYGAEVVIIDALLAARDPVHAEMQYKRRLLDLQALGALAGFTTVVLTPLGPAGEDGIAHQIADGVIVLDEESSAVAWDRGLVVRKFRGGATLRGRHATRIGDEGLLVFPRLESTIDLGEPGPAQGPRLSTGTAGLDTMLGGGIPGRTTTCVLGAPGAGKTSLGIAFLARSTPQEPGLLFGFFESAAAHRTSATGLGVDIAALERSGALTMVWQPQSEHLLDELAVRLLDAVDATGARRVLIDGYEGFTQAGPYGTRMTRFLTALSIELRRRGATTLITAEQPELVALQGELPVLGASAVFDNVVVLRHVEQHGRLVRLMSISKVRGSGFDTAVRTFELTPHGIEVGAPWKQDDGTTSAR